MADEELKITLKNEEFVRKLTEVQKAIQETKKAMDDLNKTKPTAFNTDAVSQYQKNAEALKEELDKVTKQEEELIATNKKVSESTENVSDNVGELGGKLGGFVTKLGVVTAAIAFLMKILKGAAEEFKNTAAGMNLATKTAVLWKQSMYELVDGVAGVSTTFKELNKISDAMNKARALENSNLIKNSKLQTDLTDVLYKAANASLSYKEKIVLLTEAQRLEDVIRKDNLATAYASLAANQLWLDKAPKMLDLQAKRRDLLIEIDQLESQANKRTETQVTRARLQEREEAKRKWYEEIEAKLKAQDEFQSLSLKLLDDYEKTQIDLLEGNDKITAIRDYGLKQLEEFRKQMEKLGKLSKEQEKQFAILGAGIWVAFWEGLTPEAQKKLPQKDIDAISKMLLPQLQGLVKKDVPAEMAKIKAWVDSNKEFSIWNLLGLDPNDDEDKVAIEAVKNAAEKMQNIFEEILDKRVELAQRERELLDTRISETQREIDLEAELMKEGFANNLTARQQYLEQLKKQREQALADEDKAIKQQLLAQKLIQTTNILSGVSEIIKTSAKYPVIGMILAAASIASLFAIWSQSKSKATKLEEGGSGTVTGKRHHAGGEHFLDHVEIEQGEQWGVLSRRASGKYGDMFHDMVSSFNRDQMPEFITPSTTNLVRVDNNGPNSRLDRVIKEQEKMNVELKRGQLYTVGNKRILKSGNKIRIIG